MISSDQLSIEPGLPGVSSTTYSDHVPLGAPPLKVDRSTSPLGAGAGAGKSSGSPPA